MKKKEGATLIYTIVLFMFILVVSLGMLSMVVGNYRARIAESDRLENLYGSESGLDMAYNVTGKTIEGATKYGFYRVSQLRCGYGDEANDEYAKAYEELKKDIEELKTEIEEIEKEKAQYLATTEDDVEARKQRLKEFSKRRNKCKKGINTDQSIKTEVLNEEFKKAFKEYLYIEGSESFDKDEDVLKASILNKAYVDVSLTTVDDEVDGQTIKKIKTPDYKVYYVDLMQNTEKGLKKQFEIEVTNIKFNECEKLDKYKVTNKGEGEETETHFRNVSFYRTENEYFDLELQSKFQIKEKSTVKTVSSSPRIINAAYKILIPEYNDVLFLESNGSIPDYSLISKMRGITVGGDMNIMSTDLDIKGDIFVQGKEKESSDVYSPVFDKYCGGINIESANVKFEPDDTIDNKNVNISVRKTFNIGDNVSVSAENATLYAGNVYVGDIENDGLNGHFISDSNLKVKEIITDNDLTLYATKSNVTMDNFYGINDKSYEEDEDKKKISKTSSSIIINGYKSNNDTDNSTKSTVKINEEAYILGTAHINNTESSYQTGESIAVKGNYRAYAVPISPDEVFKYEKPLQLLDTNSIEKKGKHFEDYWNNESSGGIKLDNKNHEGKITIDNGGIILPMAENDDGSLANVYTVGAIVCAVEGNEEVSYVPRNTNTYGPESEVEGGKIHEKRVRYAKNVFCLSEPDSNEEVNYYGKYLSGEEGADVVGDDVLGNLSLVDSDIWDSYSYENELSKDNSEVSVLFNPDENLVIEIKKDMKGVIVTNGKVLIGNNVEFTGSIICKGDLDVKSGGHCKIIYDESVVENSIEKEPELFKAVFGGSEVIKDEEQDTQETVTVKQVLEGKYDIKRFLKKKIWQLIQ